jgi:alpha/beta superfamily hydrolase
MPSAAEQHVTIDGTKVLLYTPLLSTATTAAGNRTPATNLAVIFTHPWKPLGGNYHNRVVHAAAKYFQSLGITTAKINFSRKKVSRGYKEVQEVISCANYLLEGNYYNPSTKPILNNNNNNHHQTQITSILLIGYSYGSLITSSASASIPACIGCVSIAPPFSVMDWLLLFNSSHHLAQAKLRSDIPRLFVIGDRDNFTSLKVFFDHVVTFPNCSNSTATSYIVIPKADHFFVGTEHSVANIIGRWWEKQQPLKKTPINYTNTNTNNELFTMDSLSIVSSTTATPLPKTATSSNNASEENPSFNENTNLWLLEQMSPSAGTPALEIIDPELCIADGPS